MIKKNYHSRTKLNSSIVLVLWPNNLRPENYEEILLWKQMRSLCRQFGLNEKRIIAIKNLKSRADFSQCLELTDVYLDALINTELVSVVQSILVGVTPVIRYSETSRGRQIPALVKELELPELIVHTEKEYMNLSVELATS
ncbi:hypothetical protein [Okeania sp. SIO2C2]|uniref:hypothetical protein n=1 Tax=Okeania sp. SIO2C2 TaxID=2607787 RepID=UPI0025804A6B|nr:hypothetical protein [Okeania sp. SIO2C2]